MRPIIKKSEPEVVYTTPPIGQQMGQSMGQPIRGNGTKDWYQTFVQQTHRFAAHERHVHFEDSYEGKEEEESNLGSNCRQLSRSNGYMNGLNGSQNDYNNNIEGNDQTWDSRDTKESQNVFTFPKIESKNPIVSSLFNNLIQPMASNGLQELSYGQSQWNQQMNHIRSSLNNTLFGDSVWANGCQQNIFNRFFNQSEDEKTDPIHLLAKKIPKSAANYTWSGQLPRKLRTKNQVFSCKVFLGGIPYDLTDSDLHCTFAQFGHIQIQWPGKDIRSAIEGSAANKAGYVYIIFETYENVSALLASCTVSYRDMDSGCRWYYNISSRRQKAKEVQVIPFDIGDRFFMKPTFSGQMDNSRTVFVGALHGMLSADGLAKVMDDLFGGVIYASLDTDKSKYPLGSGRVIFDNQDSYLKAVSAAFVEIKSSRFKKRIQIDPYIENASICGICKIPQQSPIFCRDEFIYFCRECWTSHHSDPESEKHRPIIKTKSSKT